LANKSATIEKELCATCRKCENVWYVHAQVIIAKDAQFLPVDNPIPNDNKGIRIATQAEPLQLQP
jgi:hypothetical protein